MTKKIGARGLAAAAAALFGQLAACGAAWAGGAAGPGPEVKGVTAPVEVSRTVHLSDCAVLDRGGTRYVLDRDVRQERGCFTIKASNVILDLNGHTVTYDDFPSAGVANPDFETGTGELPDGWDLSRAPGVVRRETSDFAMINRWYLFFGKAPNGTRVASSWAELPGGAKAMAFFFRGDPAWAYPKAPLWNLSVEFRDGQGEVRTLASKDFTTDQFLEFGTPAEPGRFRAVLTLVEGYGLVLKDYARYPSFDLFDLRPKNFVGVDLSYQKNVVIQNGSIVQGRGQSVRGHALSLYAGNNLAVRNLRLVNTGVESSAVYSGYTHRLSVDGCTVRTTSPGVFSRHQMNAAIMSVGGNDVAITRNTVDSGAGWGCIYVGGKNVEVAYNTLDTQSVVTNHFAIGGGTSIHDNTITADPGQGISTGGDGIEVYNNRITLKKTAPNYEYGYIDMVGIKFNDYVNPKGLFKNIKVYGNRIEIFGHADGYYSGYAGSAKVINGITNIANGGNVAFYDNTIVAHAGDPGVRVVGIEPGGRTDLEVLFRNNTVESDGVIVNFGGYAGQGDISPNLRFEGNTFIKGAHAGAFHTIGFSRTGNFTTDKVAFVGTRLRGGASLADVELPSSFGKFSYEVVWLLGVQVLDRAGAQVPGAEVVVADSGGEFYRGRTGADGRVAGIPVQEFRLSGEGVKGRSQTSRRGPQTVQVVLPGAPAESTSLTLTENTALTYRQGLGFRREGD